MDLDFPEQNPILNFNQIDDIKLCGVWGDIGWIAKLTTRSFLYPGSLYPQRRSHTRKRRGKTGEPSASNLSCSFWVECGRVLDVGGVEERLRLTVEVMYELSWSWGIEVTMVLRSRDWLWLVGVWARPCSVPSSDYLPIGSDCIHVCLPRLP